MTDAELIDGLKRQDAEAQAQAFELHRRRLLGTAMHFLGWNDPEVEDAVQDAFVAAFKAAPRFEGRSSLSTWLTAICVNQCWDRLRKRKRVIQAQDLDLELLSTSLAKRRHEDQQLGDERQRRAQALLALLEGMAGPCKEILSLRWVEGSDTYAIKARLDLPIGTVTSRLARCQEKWRIAALKAEKGGRRG